MTIQNLYQEKKNTRSAPKKKPKNLRLQYNLGDIIGEGAFSVVKLGIDKFTGEKVAIKIIEKDESNKKMDSLIRREIKIMKDLDHDNIVRLYGYDEDKTSFYVVMELVTGGELFEGIIQNRYYPEEEASPLVGQMLGAVDYLHKHLVVHRDLKPENVLFTDKKQLAIKIADFGESKKCRNVLKTYCGTPDYMAPEIIKGTPYGLEVDMWAIGIITYVLLCGYPTFDGKNELEVMANITAVNYEFPSPDWDYVSDDAKDFIDKILQADPKDRMTAEAALQHIWITNKGIYEDYFEEYNEDDEYENGEVVDNENGEEVDNENGDEEEYDNENGDEDEKGNEKEDVEDKDENNIEKSQKK